MKNCIILILKYNGLEIDQSKAERVSASEKTPWNRNKNRKYQINKSSVWKLETSRRLSLLALNFCYYEIVQI